MNKSQLKIMTHFMITDTLAKRCADFLNAVHKPSESGKDMESLVQIGHDVGKLILHGRICALVVGEEFMIHMVSACASEAATENGSEKKLLPALASASRVVEMFGDCSGQAEAFWTRLERDCEGVRELTDVLEIINIHLTTARRASATCLAALELRGVLPSHLREERIKSMFVDLFDVFDTPK